MTIMTSTDEIVRNGGGRGERVARRKGRNGRKRKTKGKDKSKPPTEPAESDKGRTPRHLSDLSDLRKQTPPRPAFNVLQFSYSPFLSPLVFVGPPSPPARPSFHPFAYPLPIHLRRRRCQSSSSSCRLVPKMQTAKIRVIVDPDARKVLMLLAHFLPFSSTFPEGKCVSCLARLFEFIRFYIGRKSIGYLFANIRYHPLFCADERQKRQVFLVANIYTYLCMLPSRVHRGILSQFALA